MYKQWRCPLTSTLRMVVVIFIESVLHIPIWKNQYWSEWGNCIRITLFFYNHKLEIIFLYFFFFSLSLFLHSLLEIFSLFCRFWIEFQTFSFFIQSKSLFFLSTLTFVARLATYSSVHFFLPFFLLWLKSKAFVL